MIHLESYIKNKIKGTIAEMICELLYDEVGCQIHRTGQEFLYPNLFKIANLNKREHHKNIIAGELESAFKDKKEQIQELKKLIGERRFQRTTLANSIAKNPDFTMSTPSGQIIQVEVKFRSDSELTDKEKRDLIMMAGKPDLFIVMEKEPFIKILVPTWSTDNEDSEITMDQEIKLYNEIATKAKNDVEKNILPEPKTVESVSIGHDAFDRIVVSMPDLPPGKEKEELERDYARWYQYVEKKVNEFFKDRFILNSIAEKHPDWWAYKEIDKMDDGAFVRDVNGLKKDALIFPKKVMDKYAKIVEETFKEQIDF